MYVVPWSEVPGWRAREGRPRAPCERSREPLVGRVPCVRQNCCGRGGARPPRGGRPWGRAGVGGGRQQVGSGVGSAFFFFQAEDGIRDLTVTGVQTCALPI